MGGAREGRGRGKGGRQGEGQWRGGERTETRSVRVMCSTLRCVPGSEWVGYCSHQQHCSAVAPLWEQGKLCAYARVSVSFDVLLKWCVVGWPSRPPCGWSCPSHREKSGPRSWCVSVMVEWLLCPPEEQWWGGRPSPKGQWVPAMDGLPLGARTESGVSSPCRQ